MASPQRVSRKASDGSPGAEDQSAEIIRLRLEVVQLRQTNAQLSGQMQVLKEGTLSRYREQLLSSSWKERFFDLRVDGSGSATLRCFRQDRRTSTGAGQLRMVLRLSTDCRIARVDGVEDDQDGEWHGFRLNVPPGSGLDTGSLCLRAGSEQGADEWVDALKTACELAGDDLLREPSAPSPATQTARGSGPTGSSALRVVHKEARDSLLTSIGGGLPDCSTVGILNLSVTVMVAMHFRLLVENFMKYGVLLAPWSAVMAVLSGTAEHLRCWLCFLGLPGFAAAMLLTELAACAGHLAGPAASAAHGFICALCLAVPMAVIQQTRASPPVGAALMMAASVLFMKLVSYAHTNTELRRRWRAAQKTAPPSGSGKDGASVPAAVEPGNQYPANLTVRDFCRFIAFPTLVYQLSYPRTERIRRLWLAKRLGELLVCLALMFIITEQFVVPTLQNAAASLREVHVLKIVERLLKLAVPGVYLWLCMFFGLFHLWLNILAEVTCFGDRLFYKEWWNATNLEDYWRQWNLPVHNWLLRHLFFPALNSGIGKERAIFLTFFVSAAFHELLVSVPCHTFRLWAFFGMMAQLPLVKITGAMDKRLKGSQLGNVVFWLIFCIVGQPLCVLLYFADSL